MESVAALDSALLGKYRVEKLLGSGGMGSVVQVTNVASGEVLALKTMRPELAADAELKARFFREAQAAERLRSEHVARVVDVGILPDGSPYIAMQYLHGVDLADELRRRMLRAGEAVDYVLQACVGLAEAHANGIVHRDIKPSNLFLTTRDDRSPLIKILDFGISKAPIATSGLTSTRSDLVMGTPAYMSPEQMKGAKGVDARSDIWSLGVVLHECLVGRRPFEAESFSALVLAVTHDPLPPLPARIPRGLQSVIMRCLAKDRGDRFPTVAALAQKLVPFAENGHFARLNVARARLLAGKPTVVEQQGTRVRNAAAGGVAAAVLGALAVLSVVKLAGGSAAIARARDPAPATTIADPGGAATPDEVAAKAVACAELEVAKEWHRLEDCAGELAGLATDRSSKDKAEALRSKAVEEAAAQAAEARLQDALRAGRLREAKEQLASLGPGSWYWAGLDDAFQAAEARAVDENRRKALGLVQVHDCAALRRLQAQAASTSTASVVDAIARTARRCVDQPPQTAAAEPDARPSPIASPEGAPATTDAKVQCDAMNVDDVVSQAGNQYSAGFAKSALQLVTRALACKQDERIYRTASLYACAAHEAGDARLYYAQVPAQFRPSIAQRCQQEGIQIQ